MKTRLAIQTEAFRRDEDEAQDNGCSAMLKLRKSVPTVSAFPERSLAGTRKKSGEDLRSGQATYAVRRRHQIMLVVKRNSQQDDRVDGCRKRRRDETARDEIEMLGDDEVSGAESAVLSTY